jgi:malonyl-CoA/methylmalonyl-CoA synthetase
MENPLHDSLFAPLGGRQTPFLHLPDGTRLSHHAFLCRAGQFASALTQMGLCPGGRMAVQVEKSPEALMLYAAAVRTGVVFLPLNTAYTPAEMGYFLSDSGASLLVCDPANAAGLTQAATGIGCRIETMDARGRGSMADAAATQAEDCPVAARAGDDLAALLYTSGTTGRSKGAMLTQANLLSNALVLQQAWKFGPEDCLLHALPVFHTHGLFVATNVTLAAGGSMILLPRFDLEAVLAALPRATTMMGVPTFYTRLLDDARLTRDLVGHIRLFISGSAPLLAETHRAFEARTGHRILERYGMTETNMNTSNPYRGERRAGTVGVPLPGIEVIVTDPDTGVELPRGQIGQIEVRGPNVFKGYWNMPEKTAAELRASGFFITGDVGIVDASGYVAILGRSKDLIISGGFNIYPKEVEEILDTVPGVLESAVIGVPHRDLGEAAVAVIVPQPGVSLDPQAISDAISELLARFKQPRKIVLAQSLPRNTMGKVQKNILRAHHADIFDVLPSR